MKTGFDNQKYLSMQSEKIRERIASFDNKLYLEFGGKLFDDYHASRVLPGFEPSSKLQMLLQLADQAEVIIVINSEDIEKNKIRADLGITYDLDVAADHIHAYIYDDADIGSGTTDDDTGTDSKSDTDTGTDTTDSSKSTDTKSNTTAVDPESLVEEGGWYDSDTGDYYDCDGDRYSLDENGNKVYY